MANIRIIYDDATQRTTGISATPTPSGNLAASTLKTNVKSRACRTSGTSVTYTLTWSSGEQINGIVLPATNLSGSATISGSIVHSGGTTSISSRAACTNTPLNSYFGVKDVNSFPYGGLSKTAVWLPTTYSGVTSLSITLTDTNRVSLGYPNYIDCSRIVCGKYWEPSIGVSKDSLSLTINDTSQFTRSDGGDLVADRGSVYEQLNFNFSVLAQADKEQLVSIIKAVGTYRNIAVSLLPDTNSRTEHDYIVYGKRDTSSIDYLIHNYYSHSFSINGW